MFRKTASSETGSQDVRIIIVLSRKALWLEMKKKKKKGREKKSLWIYITSICRGRKKGTGAQLKQQSRAHSALSYTGIALLKTARRARTEETRGSYHGAALSLVDTHGFVWCSPVQGFKISRPFVTPLRCEGIMKGQQRQTQDTHLETFCQDREETGYLVMYIERQQALPELGFLFFPSVCFNKRSHVPC